MQRTRIVYDPIAHHWSWAWLRWAATVRGLCIFTAAMSALAVYSFWQQGIHVADMVLLLLPAMGIVKIARHLNTRGREPGRTTPDASMHVVFEAGWVFVLMILLMSF